MADFVKGQATAALNVECSCTECVDIRASRDASTSSAAENLTTISTNGSRETLT